MDEFITAGFSPRISQIELYLAGDEDIQNSSVVEIKTHEAYQTGDKVIPGGINDQKLGSVINHLRCDTCGCSQRKCQGHFGFFNLSGPLLQPLAMEDMIKWLKVVCLKCGTLLIDISKIKNKGPKLQYAAQTQSVKSCPKCKEPQPKLKVNEENSFYINAIYPTGGIRVLKSRDIKSILEKISDRTVENLGRSVKSHPKKYYITKLAIPPTTIRPNRGQSTAIQRTPPIVEFTRLILRQSLNSGDERTLFQMNRYLFDMIRGGNLQKGLTRATNSIGGPVGDAILKTFNGKKGLIRGQGLGHRSLVNGRDTICCDISLQVFEAGIPTYFVDRLLIEEVVRQWNLDRLRVFLLTGDILKIHKVNTPMYTSLNITSSNLNDIVLDYGDKVFRKLQTGDYVLLNRNPSLKETAIGGHKAVPAKRSIYNAIATNVIACKGYGADYDGDQMRLKPPLSGRAKVETILLSNIEKNLLSIQTASIVNGQVMDSVIGSFRLTHSDVRINKENAMFLWSTTQLPPPKFDKKIYTGREMVSLLLRNTPIDYTGTPNYYNSAYEGIIPYKDEDTKVIIKNGVVESGIFDTSTIGEGATGSIFHLIALEYGTAKSLRIIYAYQQLCLRYLEMVGFTVAPDDLIIPRKSREQINRTISDQEKKSELFTDALVKGEIYPPINKTLNEYYEEQQENMLQADKGIYKTIFTNIDQKKNSFFIMFICGAKGKLTNIQTMYGYVAQVTLDGKRMPETYSPYRGSINYPRFSMSARARGFIANSLVDGVGPEFSAFYGQEARQQIIQKSQSTALSGSILRKHVLALMNTISDHFYHVYKSENIVQFMYADNAIDPRFTIKQQFRTVKLSDDKLKELYYYKASDKKYQDVFDRELESLKNDRDHFRYYMARLNRCGVVSLYTDKVFSGVYIDGIISKTLVASTATPTEKEIYEMALEVERFLADVPYFYSNRSQMAKRAKLNDITVSAAYTLIMLLRIELNSKHFLTKINMETLKTIELTVATKFTDNLMPPGAAVGVIAAQCYGEPNVQIMLDAIHGASSGAKATLDKIKEILGGEISS